jgi:hypothetical protein
MHSKTIALGVSVLFVIAGIILLVLWYMGYLGGSSSSSKTTDPASTAAHPASTATDTTSTATDTTSTAVNPASTAVNPASTAVNPASTAANPASTAANPASTATNTPAPILTKLTSGAKVKLQVQTATGYVPRYLTCDNVDCHICTSDDCNITPFVLVKKGGGDISSGDAVYLQAPGDATKYIDNYGASALPVSCLDTMFTNDTSTCWGSIYKIYKKSGSGIINQNDEVVFQTYNTLKLKDVANSTTSAWAGPQTLDCWNGPCVRSGIPCISNGVPSASCKGSFFKLTIVA